MVCKFWRGCVVLGLVDNTDSEVLLKFNDRVREAQKPECNADHFVFYSNGENFLATPITLKTMTSVWTITSIQGRIVVTVPPLGFHGC